MKLVFVRHGEPNYERDSLTPAGFREADALAKRISRWPVTDFFCSPLGRAQATAAPALAAAGRTAETMAWLREFGCGEFVPPDGNKDTKGVPWDFFPAYWTADPRFTERDHWMELPVMRLQPEGIEKRFAEVTDGLDGVLARYGYVREKGYYRVAADARRDGLLVFFCHLGLSGAACAHLLNLAPPLMWQSFFMAPGAITVLNSEERQPGIACFRCQVMGDTAHLQAAGEAVSAMGAFGEVFQG
jgi:broad specificity phosphatase PhoE